MADLPCRCTSCGSSVFSECMMAYIEWVKGGQMQPQEFFREMDLSCRKCQSLLKTCWTTMPFRLAIGNPLAYSLHPRLGAFVPCSIRDLYDTAVSSDTKPTQTIVSKPNSSSSSSCL